MKRLLLILFVLSLFGCGESGLDGFSDESYGVPSKQDDSTFCAYWKCSTTKKLYMQKYVKSTWGKYRTAGTFRLDEGIGAFPLEDLDKYESDGGNVSVGNASFDPCPYCRSRLIGRCSCGRTLCLPETTGGRNEPVACPWCGETGIYSDSGGWNVGGGG